MAKFRVELEIETSVDNVRSVHGEPVIDGEDMPLEEFIANELNWASESFDRMIVTSIEEIE
jgi:hypothetical protein